jgi:hypothetical protein
MVAPKGIESIEILRQEGDVQVFRYVAAGRRNRLLVLLLGGPAVCGFLGFLLGWLPGGLAAMIYVYPMAVAAFNSVTVQLSNRALSWRFGPLPARNTRKVKRNQIAAVVYGKKTRVLRKSGSVIVTHKVGLRKTNGKIWVLFDELPTEESALEAAKLLGRGLGMTGIQRTAMPGSHAFDSVQLWVLVGVSAGLAFTAWWVSL